MRINTGSCETPITTQEECEAAAAEHGKVMLPNSGNEDDRYPEGCSIPYGDRVYFNPSASELPCGGGAGAAGGRLPGHDCLCSSTQAFTNYENSEESKENKDQWKGCVFIIIMILISLIIFNCKKK